VIECRPLDGNQSVCDENRRNAEKQHNYFCYRGDRNLKMESFKYTILVVDDEELIRRLIVTFLSQLGHLCLTAGDGVDALEKMDGNKIDAVITDIKMPKKDGIILTREISTKYPGLPVMVMTAFDEEYSAGMAISVGAREFIKKPFSLDEFAIRLHKMISDSKTLERMNGEKDGDKDIQKSTNELKALNRMKSEKDVDEDVQKFIDELKTLGRMKSGKDVHERMREPMNELEKTLKKS
jgi:DNA-binding response OmpR family regulator